MKLEDLHKVLNWMVVQYAALAVAAGLLLVASQFVPSQLIPPPTSSVEMPTPAPVSDDYATLLECMERLQGTTATDC